MSRLVRKLEAGDLPLRSAWLRHEQAQGTMFLQGSFSEDDTRAWFDRISGDSTRLDVVLEDEGVPVAAGGITGIGSDRPAEVYAFVSPDARRMGYGKDLVEALCALGLGVLQLNRLYLWVHGNNQPALKLYTKCGLRQEGCLRQHLMVEGQWIDRIVMGILAEEWSAPAEPQWELEPSLAERGPRPSNR
ncbi:GNAT family protein [Scrofimicrobium sp. R131]|uniref:GNAT family protein n=1 Tax=Scrofimicrobium appendicitidis TaxID=3079930 RepID=A0AAU7V8X1_9ACTO